MPFKYALGCQMKFRAGSRSDDLARAPARRPTRRAARLTRAQVSAALKRAGRRNNKDKGRCRARGAAQRAARPARDPHDRLPAAVRSLIALIAALNAQVKILQGRWGSTWAGTRTLRSTGRARYGSRPRRPGARRVRRRPPPLRGGKACRNYAATSPVTRASGKKKVVAVRFARNDRLLNALRAQALAALNASPGARG